MPTAEHLAEVLKRNTSLKEIYLSNNSHTLVIKMVLFGRGVKSQ